MSFRILWRAEAERDIEQHFTYLVQNAGIGIADDFIAAIENQTMLLAENPDLGVQRPMRPVELRNVRMWPMRRFDEYLLFYEPVENGIRLIRVIHSKEDYTRILK